MNSRQQQRHAGPPYLPSSAPLGGIPTTTIDTPICAVLLVIYLLGLFTHTLIYLRNRTNRATKFRLSILIIYMCFLRLITMSLRMAWAAHPSNIRLAIAAQVLTTAGVILLFVLNIIFSQRIMRAWHPRFGWHPVVSWAFPVLYAMIPLSLVALITCLVQSLHTLDPHTRRVDHAVQMYGVTFFLVIAAFPVPLILINYLVLVVGNREVKGHQMADKIRSVQRPTMAGDVMLSAGIVVFATLVLVIGMGFRAGTSWSTPPPASDPAWYDSKACFYLFNFLTELAVIFLYVVARVDRLFFVLGKGKGVGPAESTMGSTALEIEAKDQE